MIESFVSARRGEPFKVFLIVLLIWVMGRVIWNEVFFATDIGVSKEIRESETTLIIDLTTEHIVRSATTKADISDREPVSDSPMHIQNDDSIKQPDIATEKVRSPQFLRKPLSLPLGLERSMSLPQQIMKVSLPPEQAPSQRPKTDVHSPSHAFSGYFWLFARQGSNTEQFGPRSPTAQFAVPQYGASQAGAILTYRILGDNRRNISAFGRASTALSSSGEEEIAVGIKAKPLSHVPVSFYAEQRFGAGGDGNRGTAIYLAGGTGPDAVVPDTSLETYGQMGYVFGRDDSYFFDVSVALQKQVIKRDRKKVTAGAAIWSSGQEGAARIDVGPRLRFHIPVRKIDMQISVDWRERIGGNANPGSGASVTLSTGF